MEIGTPFLLDITDELPQNNSTVCNNTNYTNNSYGTDNLDASQDIAVPFEFSRSRMWSENFYSPEIGAGHSITTLEKELCEIKQLVKDIKNILKDLFEIG